MSPEMIATASTLLDHWDHHGWGDGGWMLLWVD
jgi:hypothetical protein